MDMQTEIPERRLAIFMDENGRKFLVHLIQELPRVGLMAPAASLIVPVP